MVVLGLVASVLEAITVSLISSLLYLSIGGGGQPRPLGRIELFLGTDIAGLFRREPWLVGAFLVIMVLLRTAAVALYGVGAAAVKNLVFHRLRVRLYRRYMFASFEEMSQASFGFLTNTLQVEAPRVAELIDQLFRVPINGCAATVFFIVLLLLSWPVASLIGIAGLILTVLMLLSRAYLHRLGQRMMALNEELAARLIAGIQALRTIRAFGAERQEFDRFANSSRSVALTSVRFAAVENIVLPSATLATIVIIGLVILLSNALGDSAATTLTIVALLYRLQPQIQGLQSSLTSINGLESSLAHVVRIVDADSIPPSPPSTGSGLVAFNRRIRFKGVTYRHPASTQPTLKELDFDLPCGLVTAIVGQSGAGKTTIINLLLRLIEPSSGTIEVDGVDLSAIDRFAWLRNVAITGQDIDILAGSILDNLRLGCPGLSPAEAMEALELAGIAAFVEGLPRGLETWVGERGHRLSGGQRQRIALARAIVVRPRLLILDEATNAVDALLEAEIHQRLRTTFPDLTVLIVAHRSSALAGADVQIEIAEGRVSEIRHRAGSEKLAGTGA